MCYFSYKVVYFTLLFVLRLVYSLEELLAIEDKDDIAITETVIRATVNNLFHTLRINDLGHKPKLKDYSTIHNFFVSITLKDCDNLKKITRLSQVNNLDNNTLHFIAQINEVLDESDNKKYEETDDIYVNMHIEKFIKNLRDLKDIHKFNQYFEKFKLNAKILELLNNDGRILTNVTNETGKLHDTNDVPDNNNDEVWIPVLQSGRRIYNGHHTHVAHYPFVASVKFFDKFNCAGSIIKSDLIITAASCLQLAWNNRFFRENPAFLSVQVGSDFYEAGGENIPVLEIYFHHEYDPKTLNNNLALMRLNMHIVFSKRNRKVKKIDIDEYPTPLPINSGSIMIVGWGAKDNTGNIYSPWDNRLSYAELDYYPIEECQEIYTKEFVTRKHFCAGFFTQGTGACQHDVGGPGVYRGRLVGVISFGPPICGTVDAPTVFTKVGFYKDWIKKIMNMPAPFIKPLTTLLVPLITFRPHYTQKTTKTFKIRPIMDGVKPKHLLRTDTLKILEDDKLFKDFLSTMFKSDEIDYVGLYNLDRTKETTDINMSKTVTTPEGTSEDNILRNKNSIVATPTSDEKTNKNTDLLEPIKAATKILSHGFQLEAAEKIRDSTDENKQPQIPHKNEISRYTTASVPVLEEIEYEDEANISIRPKIIDTKISKSNEEYNGDSILDTVFSYFDFSKEKSLRQISTIEDSEFSETTTESATLTTYISIETEGDNNDNIILQPKMKASNKYVKFKNNRNVNTNEKMDIDRKEKTLKRIKIKESKSNKANKVRSRFNVMLTPKPGEAEYGDANRQKLVQKSIKRFGKTGKNINTDFQLDSLVKDIFEYVEGKSTKYINRKENSAVKKARSKFPTATTPLLKELKHRDKDNKRLGPKKKAAEKKSKYKNRYANTFKMVHDDDVPLLVDFSKEKSLKQIRPTENSKLNNARTKSTVILLSDEVEYEDENSKIFEPRMKATEISKKSKHKHANVDEKIDDDLTFEIDLTDISGNRNRKTSQRIKTHDSKVNKAKKETSDFIGITTQGSDDAEYEDTYNDKPVPKLTTITVMKTYKNTDTNLNTNYQLDSLVNDILDYVEGKSTTHIKTNKKNNVKKASSTFSTAIPPLLKMIKKEHKSAKTLSRMKATKIASKSKNRYVNSDKDINVDSAIESDFTKKKTSKRIRATRYLKFNIRRTKPNIVTPSLSYANEYEDYDSKIVEPKIRVTKIPRKYKYKDFTDEYINDYPRLTDLKNQDFGIKKSKHSIIGDTKLNKGKHRLSTDTTPLPDGAEYENEDGEILEPEIKTTKMSTNSITKHPITEDINNDINTDEDINKDSVLEKDISELLDELDLHKIFESAEKKKKDKPTVDGKTTQNKTNLEVEVETSAHSSDKSGSSETSG